MHELQCILDIGSASIGVTLMREDKSGTPVVSKTARVDFSTGTEEAKEGIQTQALSAVQKALDSVKAVPQIKSVRAVLAAPWYDAKITTINTRSEKTVRVNEGTVARAVREYLAKKGSLKSGPSVIESLVSQVYVNGYPTDLHAAVTGTSMRVNHYASEADAGFQKAVTDAVKKTLPKASISFHSFSFVAFAVLRALREENNFVILDVGGEITDAVIAHHDGLRFAGTFPIGAMSIARAIAGKGSIADAKSRLALYAKGELSIEENAAFEKEFSAAIKPWQDAYQSLLETAVNDVAVPQTTFLFAERDELPWLSSAIGGTHGAFSTRVNLIGPDFFSSNISLGEEGLYDSFLSAEAVYFAFRDRELIEVHSADIGGKK